MKAVKLLSHLMMFAFCAIMLASCSDDDDPVRAGLSLSGEGAVLPAEASVSPASVKVNGKGGTLTIPLVCSTTDETVDATYTASCEDDWCNASIDGSNLVLNIARTSLREGRSTTVTVQGQADGAEVRPLAVTILQGDMMVSVVVLTVNNEALQLPEGAEWGANALTLSKADQKVSLPVSIENDDNVKLDYKLNSPADATWLTATFEDGSIVLQTAQNLTPNARKATITLSVSQKNGEPLITNPLSIEVTQAGFNGSVDMVYVEGGTFKFGGIPAEEEYPNSYTYAFDCELDGFYMATTETTEKLYTEIMGTSIKKGADYPCEKFSWVEAVEFCNKLSEHDGLTPVYKQTGKVVIEDPWGFYGDQEYPLYEADMTANGYRLPTSAEWEYAAKGGKSGVASLTLYPGGNNIDELAWYRDNSNREIHPVAQKKPNALGLYDMAGNVAEFCYDWETKKTEYPTSLTKNPTGPAYKSGFDSKVYRGGYYSSMTSDCKTYYIKNGDYGDTMSGVGFRVVRNAK